MWFFCYKNVFFGLFVTYSDFLSPNMVNMLNFKPVRIAYMILIPPTTHILNSHGFVLKEIVINFNKFLLCIRFIDLYL